MTTPRTLALLVMRWTRRAELQAAAVIGYYERMEELRSVDGLPPKRRAQWGRTITAARQRGRWLERRQRKALERLARFLVEQEAT